MRKITNVEIIEPLRLKITFDNGRIVDFDASPLIRRGGLFASLSETSQFKKVKIGPRGRSLEWPGKIDLCADSIWISATGEREEFDDKAS